METLYPAGLIDFFQHQQAMALLILVVLVVGTAGPSTSKTRALFGVCTVVYGIIAFLVMVSIVAHGAAR